MKTIYVGYESYDENWSEPLEVFTDEDKAKAWVSQGEYLRYKEFEIEER